MARVKIERTLSPVEGASSVLKQFISPETSPGKFFVGVALPKEWRPKPVPRKSLWAMEFRRHSTAFITVELRKFDVFGRLKELEISDARALARPIGAWIGQMPDVELWDQIGGFDRNLGHWHFLYRDKTITGSLDIFIIPKTKRSSLLIASITEHVSFR